WEKGKEVGWGKVVWRHAQQENDVARIFEPLGCDMLCVLNDPEHSDDRRRKDATSLGLVVEADIAAGDGSAQRTADFADAINTLAECPHHFRSFGIGEVEAIGDGQRASAAANYIARGFGHCQSRAFSGIEMAIT